MSWHSNDGFRDKYKAEAAKRSTDAGKKTQFKQMNEILSFFSKKNTASLVAMFDLTERDCKGKTGTNEEDG